MSFQDIQVREFPKFGSDRLLRNANRKYTLMLRSIKKTVNRKISRSLTHLRHQYYLTTATKDLKVATYHNEDIVIASFIITSVLIFSYLKMASEIMFLSLKTAYEFAELTRFNMVVLFFAVLCCFAVIAGWLVTFLMNTIAISIMEGATRKRYKSIRTTLRKSLNLTSRVAAAWLAYLAVISIPQIVIATLTIVFMLTAQDPMVAIFSIIPWIAIASATSIVLLTMNYSLVPYIALFENNIPLSRTFKRSHQLVKTKGRLFILGTHGFFVLALVSAYVISNTVQNVIHIPSIVTFFILASAIALYTHCLHVILYRKRKLARK